jgi:hypothetical protein
MPVAFTTLGLVLPTPAIKPVAFASPPTTVKASDCAYKLPPLLRVRLDIAPLGAVDKVILPPLPPLCTIVSTSLVE